LTLKFEYGTNQGVLMLYLRTEV